MSLVSKECWRLQCSEVVMASHAEGGNGIPALKCIPSGKGKFSSTSHGGLNDVTCNVRVQYIWLQDLQASLYSERSNDFKNCFLYHRN